MVDLCQAMTLCNATVQAACVVLTANSPGRGKSLHRNLGLSEVEHYKSANSPGQVKSLSRSLGLWEVEHYKSANSPGRVKSLNRSLGLSEVEHYKSAHWKERGAS
jgi:hypothetical protein